MPIVAYDPELQMAYSDYGNGLTAMPADAIVGADLNALARLPTPDRYTASKSQPAPAAAPAPAPMTASPVATGMSPRAKAVLDKRDAVMGPLQLAGGSKATSVQKGVAPEVLNPLLDQNTAGAERLATATEQAGEAKSQRGEQAAMAMATDAYGRQQTAEQEAATARQRAEIARLNQLVLTAQTDPEVDPDRFVKNMSTGKSIGMVVLAALNGAFKGIVGQQGNDVMQLFQQRVEQDIAAQKEQIQSGRIRRGNMIQFFSEQGMKEESAEKAAKAVSYAMLDRMAQAEAERIGSAEARENAKLLSEQIRAEAAKENVALQTQLGLDRTTEQTSQSFAPPAPKGGGDNTKNIKEALELDKALEERGYTKDQRQAAITAMGLPVAGGKSAPELAREEKTGKEQTDERAARAAVETIQQIDNELSAIPQDKVWTKEGRNAISRSLTAGIDAVFGEDTWRQWFVSEDERNAARTFALAKSQLMAKSSVILGQGALGDQERRAVEGAIQASNNPKELRAAAQQVMRLAKAGQRGITGKDAGQGTIASEAF